MVHWMVVYHWLCGLGILEDCPRDSALAILLRPGCFIKQKKVAATGVKPVTKKKGRRIIYIGQTSL